MHYDFYKLAQVLPSHKYAIVIVGKLTERVKENNSGCQMVFVDRTQNALELAQLYSSAAVFVNPTYADSFPTVNMEALACGTSVITYRTGGSPEIIDNNTGVVVEQGDIDGLVQAIDNMKEKPLSSEKCRTRALERFDKEQRFMDYIHLYEELVK